MKKSSNKSSSTSSGKDSTCCKVESVVMIDERGQMVLPKEIRDAVGIHAGDKLAVIPWKKDDKVCCITLMRVEELTDVVKDKLGPVLKNMM